MVIATFNSATGWAGKTITHDDGVFTLEGHGAISAVDVLTYDRQGHISWAYEGLREWVQGLAAPSAVAAPQVQPIGVAPPLNLASPRRSCAKSQGAQHRGGHRRCPGSVGGHHRRCWKPGRPESKQDCNDCDNPNPQGDPGSDPTGRGLPLRRQGLRQEDREGLRRCERTVHQTVL